MLRKIGIILFGLCNIGLLACDPSGPSDSDAEPKLGPNADSSATTEPSSNEQRESDDAPSNQAKDDLNTSAGDSAGHSQTGAEDSSTATADSTATDSASGATDDGSLPGDSDDNTNESKSDTGTETGPTNQTTSENTDDSSTDENTDESTETEQEICGASPCNGYLDDCPSDRSCILTRCPSAVESTLECAPIGERKLGEACLHPLEGGTLEQGCGKGLMCLGRTCRELCKGDEDNPSCSDLDGLCRKLHQNLGICFERCDPLNPVCTTQSDVCVPQFNPDAYNCTIYGGAPDGGEYGDRCAGDYLNVCRDGYTCLPPGGIDAPGCEATDCCSVLCDLSNPNCPGPREVCEPHTLDRIADYEHVGICRIPDSDARVISSQTNRLSYISRILSSGEGDSPALK